MKEVEILVQVYDNKETVLNSLKYLTFKGKKETLDIYYYDTLRNNLQVKNNKYPIEWFRLRKKNNKSFLTYKKDNYKDDIWLYSDEDETEITEFEIGKTIINKLGLKELITIDNIKHTFETKLYEIVFEEVKNLGLFLEVERLKISDTESVEEIKIEIQKFINTLKLNVSPELNIGKPELMLRQNLKTTNTIKQK